MDRSKKRLQLWKKAMLHFSLCFVMGFFTGFAPAGTSYTLKLHIKSSQGLDQIAEIPAAVPTSRQNNTAEEATRIDEAEWVSLKQVIVITPTNSNDRLQGPFMERLGHTLKLVPQPLLWIVVESSSDSSELSERLMKTGIMYRHIVYKENFTDSDTEMDYQRNLALNHIEHHRLNGIVVFAGVYDVYGLEFFEKVRGIEDFGTWPSATLRANRKRVVIQGPVCENAQVVGWHPDDSSISISNIGFNSSILWDPERWGRLSSIQDTSQDSVKFVQEIVLEDETKLKGLPEQGCSKIVSWHLHLPCSVRGIILSSFRHSII